MKNLFKPLLSLAVLGTLVFGVAACTTDSNNQRGLTSDQTIAYSTYMAGAFLSGETSSNTTSSNTSSVMYLDTHTNGDAMLRIEEELGEVNAYFNRLRVFLDNGMENPFEISRDLDVEGDWDITMGYTVEDSDYTILLNEDEEGNLTGTLILDGVEYEVEGSREVESETETDDGETTTESEQEIYLKTIDIENSDNFIELTIETEDDDEEYEFEMEMISMIDGVETVLNIEFEIEEDEVSIQMETENGNTYSFSCSTENNAEDIDYEFEYTVNGVEGEVELSISIDDNGNKVYHYTIEEDGEEKEFTLDEDGNDISEEEDTTT